MKKVLSLGWGPLAASLLLTGCELLTGSQDAGSPPVVTSPSSYTIGSVADSRQSTTWTLDGSQMTTTRAKLLDPANFGGSGTVKHPLTITDTAATVGSITPTLMAGFKVFFIGYLNNASPNALTPAELDTLEAWVRGGGVLVVTADGYDYGSVAERFGFDPSFNNSPSASAIPPVTGTAAGTAAGKPFGGPFGSVSSLNVSGWYSYFVTLSNPHTVLGVDFVSNPVVVEQSRGTGRVILLGDIDLISNQTLSSGTTITTDNDRFLGNLFAYAVTLAGG